MRLPSTTDPQGPALGETPLRPNTTGCVNSLDWCEPPCTVPKHGPRADRPQLSGHSPSCTVGLLPPGLSESHSSLEQGRPQDFSVAKRPAQRGPRPA